MRATLTRWQWQMNVQFPSLLSAFYTFVLLFSFLFVSIVFLGGSPPGALTSAPGQRDLRPLLLTSRRPDRASPRKAVAELSGGGGACFVGRRCSPGVSAGGGWGRAPGPPRHKTSAGVKE